VYVDKIIIFLFYWNLTSVVFCMSAFDKIRTQNTTC